MIIDCDSCEVRGDACGDCVVGVLLGTPSVRVADRTAGRGAVADLGWDADEVPSGAPVLQLDAPERRALAVLADQGLVPRLRLVAIPARRASHAADGERTIRNVG